MDRAMIQRHLAEAEGHIRQGKALIAKQREILNRLEKVGADPSVALKMLENLEAAQAMHVTDRERIAAELAAAEK
jgi:hypothetical protein